MASLSDRDVMLALSFLVSAVIGFSISRLYKQVDAKADKVSVDGNHAAILRELDQIQKNQARADQKLNDILTATGTHKSL
jgi:thioesterase domain-containing protein